MIKPSEDVSFVISRGAMRRILAQLQTYPNALESGGLLLGRIFGSGNDSAIEVATLPGKGDQQSRHSFYRSGRHQRIADKYWRKSGETRTYLGSWHTHPEARPAPSGTDMNDWRQALRKDVFYSKGLLFVIAGTDFFGFWHGKRPHRIRYMGHLEIAAYVNNLYSTIGAP